MESQVRCKPDNLVDNNMLHVLCKKERSEELIDFALMILIVIFLLVYVNLGGLRLHLMYLVK